MTVIIQGLNSTLLLSGGFTFGARAQASNPSPLTQGWLRGPLVTQGYAAAPVAPKLPADPTVVTMGYLGKPGAVFVQGYHLYVPTPPPAPDVYSDPYEATWYSSTSNPVPDAATWSRKAVDPAKATWNIKTT